MPPVFAPAEPLSSTISSQYGATEQFDKTLPTLASLYESGQRNQTGLTEAAMHQQQAGAQLSQQRLQADQAGAQQRWMAQQQFAEQQNRQQAASDLQFQSWALKGQEISQQEINHANQLQAGIGEIMKQKADGNLTEEEAGGLIMQMKTGLDIFKQRREQAQAQDAQAQAEMRSQQTANMAKDNAHMEQFESDRIKAGYGTLSYHDSNGRMHVLLKNKKTDEWYNPLLDHIGKEDASAQAPFSTKSGEFDAAAALKDAKARAESITQFWKTDDKGKRTMTEEGHQWIEDTLKGRERNWREAKNGPPMPGDRAQSNQSTGQTAPPNTPDQQAQAQNDQRGSANLAENPQQPQLQGNAQSLTEKIQSNPRLGEFQKRLVTQAIADLHRLTSKPKDQTTPSEREAIKGYLDLIQKSAQ